ncbi:unnamed protein product [Closterium sp. NIES-64]|nr:unnamed protein product [Closterium sp. NIES-64]
MEGMRIGEKRRRRLERKRRKARWEANEEGRAEVNEDGRSEASSDAHAPAPLPSRSDPQHHFHLAPAASVTRGGAVVVDSLPASPEEEPVMLDCLDRCLALLGSGSNSKIIPALSVLFPPIPLGLSPPSSQPASPEEEPVMLDSLDRCLALLGSGNKSKVTMALVAVLAYVASGDVDNMNNVYDALPFSLLEAAFRAAVAKGSTGSNGMVGSTGSNGMVEEEELVHAALAVLALLLQEPDLAYAPQTTLLVPHLVGLIRNGYDPVVAVDAYECLLGVATGSDAGLKAVKGADVLGVVAENIQRSSPGCESLASAMQLLGFLFMSGVADIEMYEYKHEFAAAVPALARELAERTDMLKYEVLKLLVAMLSSEPAEPVRSVVQTFDSGSEGRQWAHDIRAGLADILLDSNGEEFRKDALQLVRVVAEIQGEAWLVETGEGGGAGSGANGLSAVRPSPADRFLLVLLQALKVEMPPLLQELAVLTIENEEEAAKEGEGGEGGGGLGRAGGLGKGEITRMQSLVPTSEDWRSVVNEMVWEPPKDNDDDPSLLQIEEEVPEETGPPEEVKRLYRVLGDCYCLVEKVITALAGAAAEVEKGKGKGGAGGEEKGGEEGEMEVVMLVERMGVETVQVCVKLVDAIIKDILIFLQLAQERERYSHDGVLSAVKVLGSYLAVAPSAHRKRVGRLLGFMLGVKGEDEDRPLLASRYLLPALVHMSSEPRGCNSILKRGGHRFLIEYVAETGRTNMTGQLRSGVEGQTSLMQAADVILNLFSFRRNIKVPVDPHDFVPLLASMAAWSSVKSTDPKITYKTLAMAACVNVSMLQLSSEDIVKKKLDLATYKKLPASLAVIVKFLEFGHRNCNSFSSETEIKELWDVTLDVSCLDLKGLVVVSYLGVSYMVVTVLEFGHRNCNSFSSETEIKELWDVTLGSCQDCLLLWPQLKRAIVKSEYWARVSRQKAVTQERLNQVCKDERLRKLLALVAFSN